MSEMKAGSPPRKFADRSLAQLTLVRFREFTRQPEAVFWTFVFPILLAVGLGLAFRSRAPERPRIGVLSVDQGSAAIVNSLKADSSLIAQVFATVVEHLLQERPQVVDIRHSSSPHDLAQSASSSSNRSRHSAILSAQIFAVRWPMCGNMSSMPLRKFSISAFQ